MTSETIEQQQTQQSEQTVQANENINLLKKKLEKKRLMEKEYEIEPANIITNIVSWAAKEKHPLAMYLMGIFFLGYYKVNPNFEKAVFWFKRAIKYRANKNFGGVEYYLGHCYENGFGIAQNTSKALDLYTTAANKKFPQAMKKLSVCYAKGILGCNVDKELSNMWNKMYEEGDNYVWNMNSDLSNAGYKVDMFAAEEQLIDVIEDAREVGNIEAEYCLGLFYDAGFGGIIERDETKALQCFKTAATKGHAGAMYCLAKYNEDGKGGCPKQPDVAMKLYREAALNGDRMAKEVVKRYKYMPMSDEARAMVKEARRQRIKEEAEEELIRRNSSTSDKLKAKVQQVIYKPPRKSRYNKGKGKAPEGTSEGTTVTTTTTITNGIVNNVPINNDQRTNNYNVQGSSSSNHLRVSNKPRMKTGAMLKLSPLIEESYSTDNSVVTTEEQVNTIEASKIPLYPNENVTEKEPYPEPGKELDEDEKRKIIANNVKVLSEEYNMVAGKIDDNNDIFKNASGGVNILENEVIGSDYSDSNYNTIPEQKVDAMEEIKEVHEVQINEPVLDDKLKSSSSKKGFGLFKKVKSINKKKHTKSDEIVEDIEADIDQSNTIKNKTKNELKEFGKDVKNASSKASEKTKNGFKNLANKTSEVGSEMKEGIGEAAVKTGHGIKNLGEKTKDGFMSLGHKTKELGSDMKDGIENTADKVGDSKVGKGFKNLGEKTKDGFKSLGRKTKELGSDTKDGIKSIPDKTSEIGSDVKDGIEDAADSTGSKFKNLGEKTKDGFKSLGRKTKELGSDMKEGLEHTTSKTGKGLKKLGEKTKELGRDIKDVPDKTSDLGSEVKYEVKDTTDSTGSKLKDLGEKTKDGFKSLGRKTKELGSDMKDGIENTADKVGDSKVGKGFKDLGEKTKDGFKSLGHKTKELGSDMKDGIEHAASKTGKGLKKLGEKTKEEAKEVKNDIKDISKKTGEKTSEVKDKITDTNDKLSIFENVYEEEPEDRSILEAIDEASRATEDINIPLKDTAYVVTEEIVETVETTPNTKDKVKQMTKAEKDKDKKSFGFGFKKFFLVTNKN